MVCKIDRVNSGWIHTHGRPHRSNHNRLTGLDTCAHLLGLLAIGAVRFAKHNHRLLDGVGDELVGGGRLYVLKKCALCV